MTLKENISGNGHVDRTFMDLEKEIKRRGYSDLVLGLYTRYSRKVPGLVHFEGYLTSNHYDVF